MSEIKHYLRKVEFPQVVLETFRQIEQLWSCVGHVEGLQSCPKVVYEIVDEFIFQEIDRKGNPRRPLTPIKELQVLNNIEMYFSQQTSDVKSNNVFLVLFPPAAPHQSASDQLPHRLHVLCRLLSMAVVLQNSHVLTSGGIWMQINGCNTPSSKKIAQTIVGDYFRLVPSTVPYLRDLPCTSPIFCASLITAIASWFSSASVLPEVVEIVYEWVNTTPLLCIAPLHTSAIYPLPRPQTPLLSLLLWTVLAPLDDDIQPKAREVSCWSRDQSVDFGHIYSGLHLAILDTMIKVTQNANVPPQAVEMLTVHDVNDVVDSLHVAIKCVGPKAPKVEVALNRLGQALQVAIQTACLKGNLNELFARLSSFPPNRLLCIVSSKCGNPG